MSEEYEEGVFETVCKYCDQPILMVLDDEDGKWHPRDIGDEDESHKCNGYREFYTECRDCHAPILMVKPAGQEKWHPEGLAHEKHVCVQLRQRKP